MWMGLSCGPQVIAVPRGARVLSIAPGSESALLGVWILADDTEPPIARALVTVLYDEPIDVPASAVHAGTWFGPSAVWHLFDLGERPDLPVPDVPTSLHPSDLVAP